MAFDNTFRDSRARVQDFTKPRELQRKRIPTLTDSGGLLIALGGISSGTESGLRLSKPGKSADGKKS